MNVWVTLLFLASSQSFAVNTHTATLSINQNNQRDTYIVKADEKTGSLSSQFGNQPAKNRELKSEQARNLVDDANQIVWKAKYRSPAYRGACVSYVKIQIDSEEPHTVCTQNRRAAGEAHGLLIRLKSLAN